MAAPRVILDFPDDSGNVRRLRLERPRRVLAADTVGAVRPALREAEAASRAGAWVAGFLAYEAAPAFDPALVTRPHAGPTPLLWLGIFDSAEEEPAPATGPVVAPGPWHPDTSRAEYDDAIRTIRDAIAAGDVYQVNHTLRFTASCDIAPPTLHDAFVAARHGRYHALIETDAWAVVSASPELFIDVRDGSVTTRPMKGTLRRGRWTAEDDAAAARLAASAKDRAENLMIVDLLRNDLGRIARFGTVQVEEMFAVETYPTVHQMTSTIRAQLRNDTTIDDIFAAMFPCGSITGAPKIAAMQKIAALEHSPRGPYCGAIGIMRPDGTATFNVAIRTLLIDQITRTAVFGSGGGITWDSSADAEYDEAVAKATLLDDDTPPFELLETMRLDNGVFRRLDRHLARLADSARYWRFHPDVERIAAAALERERVAAQTGVWRIRMTVSRDGRVHTTRTPLDPHASGIVAAAGLPATGALPRVALAHAPVSSADRMLFHKTTARSLYDAHRASRRDAFDVLMYNERGNITEFTIGNVVCEIDGSMVTPPREDGLLPGVFRETLLASGEVVERSVSVEELSGVTRMWLVNSVREWVEVRLV